MTGNSHEHSKISPEGPLYTDYFGLHVTYYSVSDPSRHFTDLGNAVREHGHGGLDDSAISSFLTFRYPVGDRTMFKDYRRVPFGSSMDHSRTVRKQWIPRFSTITPSFNEALKTVEALLLDALKKLLEHSLLEDQEKVAVPLSGGVDSSLITAMIRHLYPDADIRTYSAGFYGDDEFEYSRIVAEHFNTRHTEKVLGKDDYIGKYSLLGPLIRHKAEPLHPNEIALAEVERIARSDGCSIGVCGEGSDDIFGGYGQNLRMYINYPGGSDTGFSPRDFFRFFLDNYRYFSLEDGKRIVRDRYLQDDIELLMGCMPQAGIPKDIRDAVFYFTQKIHTPGLITRGANAMRFNSINPGFPFCDPPLVDYVNSLPFGFKIAWKSPDHERWATEETMHFRELSEKMDIPKYILKKIAERYLPEEIIYRRKKGFPVPFEKWLYDMDSWPLDQEVFTTDDISGFSGWKKFMLINLNTFIEEFLPYRS